MLSVALANATKLQEIFDIFNSLLKTFYIYGMVYIGKGEYIQAYFSRDFFKLSDVREDEVIRLKRLGVEVFENEISVGDYEGELVFFLHLYIRGFDRKPLDYIKLFGQQ